MDPLAAVSEELAEIDGQIADIFRALSNGFQKLEKVKDVNRQSRQLEELTDKMRECKRLIKEFDREVKEMESRTDANTHRMLNEKKQSMIKELNSYVALKKQHQSNLENKNRVDLFDGPNEGFGEENVLLASSMTNQQLMDRGNQMMDETDQAIDRAKKVVQDTVDVGTETAAALKSQTEQMSRIVNELDSIHFSIKKASKLVKEIGRQLVNPNNKDIRDIPGLAPPAMSRRLLWTPN
ncbi:novel plant SNARE 11-like isoform X2 [Durio zibethinus]|uniref:Novel plant SNARE 11-like isoform X2 n=1 Tax=Durio zibethinus TaxID=66656 RepID=A0A6P5YAE2_DURZI|nr:novel plant SNARE 11-like isoform X2 [Durio zibethinus]